MARAPCQVAICTAAWPTLPLTPMTSTVSPGFGMPARRKPSIAVTKGTPMPAASSQEMLFGFSTTASASTARCVAWVPSRRMPRSPEEPNTSRPIAAGRAVDHHAGIVAARRARKHRIGHQPGRGLDVGRIDRGGLDLDQHLVWRRATACAARPPARAQAAFSALALSRTQRASTATGLGVAELWAAFTVSLTSLRRQELPFRPLVVNTLGLAERALQRARARRSGPRP